MKLTGKCREDFEKWYNKNSFMLPYFTKEYSGEGLCFKDMDKSMQYGVYIDFLNTKKWEGVELFDKCFNVYFYEKVIFQTHNDIVKQAIEKANEIYNT
jgi:hypothetical protein